MPEAKTETVAPAEVADGGVLDTAIARTMERTDLAMMRIENESIMAECRVRPRNLERIKAELADMLRAFPDLAQDAIYAKPVGRDEAAGGQQKIVRGLSIRAAEALAEVYGYNRVRADVTPLDDARVKIEATFTDFQRGRIWQDSGILSQLYKSKRGGMQRYNDDRFYSVVVKAEVSRRIREVILRSVNAALKAWFEARCEELLTGLLSDTAVQKIVESFATLGVSGDQLAEFVGHAPSLGWSQQDRQTLLGLWNALKDGETTIAEAFGEQKPAPVAPGPVHGTDLAPQSADNGPKKAGAKRKQPDQLFDSLASATEAGL